MTRTVVGLFTSPSEAEFATLQLRAAGFAGPAVQLATRETLRAQHLPGPEAAAEESFQDGLVRFFSDIFSGTPLDDAQAYLAATGPDHAVVTVATTTPEEAETARQLLDCNGAIDVYKQRIPSPATAGTGEIDLEGDLSRVRDDDELDANGLTTH